MKIKVLPTSAIVKDLELLDHKQIRYVGKKQNKSTLQCEATGEVVELDITNARYRTYYVQKLLAGDLIPADEYTAKLIGR